MKMPHALPLLAAVPLAAVLLAAAARTQVQNTLLILADDVGAEAIACYGLTPAPPPTPNLDALAARGVRFRNAWSNPLCSPTRATVLAGRHSFRTGVGTALGPGQQGLRLDEWLLPEVLAPAGIDTAWLGKWHAGDAQGPGTPNVMGFGHFVGHLQAALPDFFVWPKTRNGQTTTATTYATTDTVNEALAWIGARQRPWLAVVSFHAAHTPLHAPPAHLHTQNLAGLDPRTQPIPFFKAMVQAMDREIGRLLAGIPAAVLAGTNVVFLGDNGTAGNTIQPPFPTNHAKGTLYQGGITVPLLVAGPRVAQPGRAVDAVVHTCDLFPTVGAFAGVDVRAVVPASVPLDGVSLLPYLANPAQPPLRDTVYAELFGYLAQANGHAIRNATHKRIRFTGTNPRDEFYDLGADPHEQRNLLLGTLSAAERRHFVALGAAAAALRGERYFGVLAQGCAGTRGRATVSAPSGGPGLGQSFSLVFGDLPLGTTSVIGFLGLSHVSFQGLPLPLDLGALAMPQCTLDASMDLVLPVPAAAGAARLDVPIPAGSGLLGLWLFPQAVVPDPGANGAGLITSAAGHAVIGRP